MKIYGKSFGAVFDMLPWQHKAVVVLSISFILFIILHLGGLFLSAGGPPAVAPLRIHKLGKEISVYDPALAVDPSSGRVVLAFSNIRAPGGEEGARGAPVIRLAAGKAPCGHWTVAPEQMAPREDHILAPDSETVIATGAWRYETPAVVFDPGDPGREWKLFAYKYFWTGDGNVAAARRYGVIVARHAADPFGEWSTEEWLLSPAQDYPPPPYDSLVRNHINALDPSLADVTIYARPSVVLAGDALVMSLSAFTGKAVPDRIVMLASFDRGASWKYMGTPLRAADLPAIGPYTRLGGATLLQQEGRVYLAAVLGDAEMQGLGTFFFDFADFSAARLKTDGRGAPELMRHLPLQSERPAVPGGGYAAYSDACGFGMLTGEMSGVKGVFQLFQTQTKPRPD